MQKFLTVGTATVIQTTLVLTVAEIAVQGKCGKWNLWGSITTPGLKHLWKSKETISHLAFVLHMIVI